MPTLCTLIPLFGGEGGAGGANASSAPRGVPRGGPECVDVGTQGTWWPDCS